MGVGVMIFFPLRINNIVEILFQFMGGHFA